MLTGARLAAGVQRYRLAPVLGPKLITWRGYVMARNFTMSLARSITALAPAPMRGSLQRRLRRAGYGNADAVLGSFISKSDMDWCAARIARLQPAAILIDTIFRAPLLRAPELASTTAVIIAHDVFHRRHRALSSAGYRVYPAALSAADEAGLLTLAGTVAAIQPEEAALIAAMCPEVNTITAPMPAMLAPRGGRVAKLPDRLVFVGSASLPNLDGLRWFFAEVWPRLRAWRPTITLDLIGDCGAAIADLPPGVTRLGRCKDLTARLHGAALAISPLRAGSGLKIKMLDYARHGLMTVATPVSLAGFAADAQTPFIEAPDAVAFASAVADYLQPNTEHEARALNYIGKHYSVARCFAPLAAALQINPEHVS